MSSLYNADQQEVMKKQNMLFLDKALGMFTDNNKELLETKNSNRVLQEEVARLRMEKDQLVEHYSMINESLRSVTQELSQVRREKDVLMWY